MRKYAVVVNGYDVATFDNENDAMTEFDAIMDEMHTSEPPLRYTTVSVIVGGRIVTAVTVPPDQFELDY